MTRDPSLGAEALAYVKSLDLQMRPHGSMPMHDPETIAVDVLKCALAHEPNVCLIGNVMACEVAALAARYVMTCPKCGAEAWCDIDCDLCLVCSQLIRGEVP